MLNQVLFRIRTSRIFKSFAPILVSGMRSIDGDKTKWSVLASVIAILISGCDSDSTHSSITLRFEITVVDAHSQLPIEDARVVLFDGALERSNALAEDRDGAGGVYSFKYIQKNGCDGRFYSIRLFRDGYLDGWAGRTDKNAGWECTSILQTGRGELIRLK